MFKLGQKGTKKGLGPLVRLEGRVTADVYINVLEMHLYLFYSEVLNKVLVCTKK